LLLVGGVLCYERNCWSYSLWVNHFQSLPTQPNQNGLGVSNGIIPRHFDVDNGCQLWTNGIATRHLDVDDHCQVSTNGILPRGMTCDMTPVKDLAIFQNFLRSAFSVMGPLTHIKNVVSYGMNENFYCYIKK
jgi:hypothetical protein